MITSKHQKTGLNIKTVFIKLTKIKAKGLVWLVMIKKAELKRWGRVSSNPALESVRSMMITFVANGRKVIRQELLVTEFILTL
jgi:hypothetical protein